MLKITVHKLIGSLRAFPPPLSVQFYGLGNLEKKTPWP